MRFSSRALVLGTTLVPVLTLSAAHASAPAAFSSTGLPAAAPRADAPSGGFAWPINPHVVIQRFNAPDVQWGPGHRGVDLAAPAGTPVRAPADGVVSYSGVIAGKGVVSIRHPQGFNTTYETLDRRIAQGTHVRRGDVIGLLTNGHLGDDHCPQVCLHWGYKVSRDEYRDPLTLIGVRRPVLLPPLPLS